MSIFKETFKDFIFRQLGIREAIVQLGNNKSSRFNSLNEINVKNRKETINVPRGAFYTNSISKQCVIRMASGVDITSQNHILEPGEKKDTIAEQYILEGGVLNDRKKQKSGFAKENGAYGDKLTRSDAGDGYGIVPMPGIIEADIRTKTAYGSLREANVSFTCHNRRQLEILELLYMRPGMPILLEWQWSPFINLPSAESKTAIIDKNVYGVIKDWFNPGSKSINDFELDIINEKKESGGNYDGFIGFCKNFEIVSRDDGGYQCTTELISAGEVLEGLKSRSDGFGKFEGDAKVELDNMQLILDGIIELGPVREQLYIEGQDRAVNQYAAYGKLVNTSPVGNEFLRVSENIDIRRNYNNASAENKNRSFRAGKNSAVDNQFVGANKAQAVAETLPKYFEKVDDFYIWKGEIIGQRKAWYSGELDSDAESTYIRWDHLCDLMNKLVFPLYDPSNPDKSLVKLTYEQPINGDYENLEYLEYANIKLPDTKLKEVNINRISNTLLKNKYRRYKLSNKILVEDLLNNSFNPKICLFPKQNNKNENPKNFIGYIMLNVNHLKSVYNKMAYDEGKLIEDFNIFDYIKKIWDDVNKACVGHHNFNLNNELERPDTLRIIDLQVAPPEINIEDLYTFKIQSNKSIIRDFNFNTTIPSNLTATIAIASQAPTSMSDLDAVTFANWTRGIKSRFSSNIELNTKNTSDLQIKYLKDLERYQENVFELALYLYKIQQGDYDGEGDKIDKKGFTEVSGLAKSIDKLLISLLQRNPKDGKRTIITPLKRSALIPLKFNAAMDGISGIVIGNIFKVEKDKLPIGYQDDDVAFVVMGESQRITSGQDWVTELSGQLILLDLNKEKQKTIEKIYNDDPIQIEDIPSIQDNTEVILPPIPDEIIEDRAPIAEDIVLGREQEDDTKDKIEKLRGDGFIYKASYTSEVYDIAVQGARLLAIQNLLIRAGVEPNNNNIAYVSNFIEVDPKIVIRKDGSITITSFYGLE